LLNIWVGVAGGGDFAQSKEKLKINHLKRTKKKKKRF